MKRATVARPSLLRVGGVSAKEGSGLVQETNAPAVRLHSKPVIHLL